MEIKITRKNIKNIIIKVEDGIVLVSAPKRTSKNIIDRIIKNNEKSIEKMLKNDILKNRYENHLLGNPIDKKYSEKELEKLYRKTLEEILPSIFRKYEKLTGLCCKEYKIRKMKKRWGTCYHHRKLILINLNIAKRPIEEIEATVLHEIIHLKHDNHSREFYKELEKYMPNYKNIEKELKK